MTKGFKKFLLLWSGELVSSIGGGLTSFGLTVYVFSKTGSAASTALIALLAFLPNLLLGVPAGVLADLIAGSIGISVGRGSAAVIMISGILLAVSAVLLYLIKSVRELESDNKKQSL